MDCIFCKISQGDIPSEKVYENDKVLAFLDIKPHARGHTVVIPKEHGETVFDLAEDDYIAVMEAVVVVMKKLKKLEPDGFNVGWNHNTAGGQVVPHLHVHVMPRYHGDGGGSMHSIVNKPGDVEEVVKLLQ
jgi:histidine triad (HIT) family protein